MEIIRSVETMKNQCHDLMKREALITSLNFPIELIGIETAREDDGLAKSSRNVHLSNEERKEAVWIYKALMKGQQLSS